MNIVFVGHVDHGKSSVIGRMLADTNTLPEGKLENIKEKCKRESKAFEYAFLLDALKDEQSQGITIDSARCFFKTKKREYIIIDAPGHIEFLKNMVSGASRASAAVVVIDASEGVQENSFRHAYMLSMLGIEEVIVCVNKMDLVKYDKQVFETIKQNFEKYLESIGVSAKCYVPVSAIEGVNIAKKGVEWYKGSSLIDELEALKEAEKVKDKALRMVVQDVYRFSEKGDTRRIVAGRVESGKVVKGDKVIFYPSFKTSKVEEVIGAGLPGHCIGIILSEQIYIKRSEVMVKESEQKMYVSRKFEANVFWLGKDKLETNKKYKVKIGTARVYAEIEEIAQVIDASTLKKVVRKEVLKNEAATCVIKCSLPIAFDLNSDFAGTGRFVIVDGYDIAGGGIITKYIEDGESHVREQVLLREKKWERGYIDFKDRVTEFAQVPTLILITGKSGVDKKSVAKEVEKELFYSGRKVYFLGIGNLLRGLDADIVKTKKSEHVRRLAEVANILMDAGLIVVATASDLEDSELNMIETICSKMVIVTMDKGTGKFDVKLESSKSVKENAESVLKFIEKENGNLLA